MRNTRFLRFFLAVAAVSFIADAPALAQVSNADRSSTETSGLPGISGDVGMSQKGTSVYRRMSRRALRSLEENKDSFYLLGQGEATSTDTRLEFERFCTDSDHSDVLSWQVVTEKSTSTTRVTFSCVLDTEFPRIQERLFVFSYETANGRIAAETRPRLSDIQIASASIASVSQKQEAKVDFDQSVGATSNSPLSSPVGKVAIAISGAVLSSGTSAGGENASESGRELDGSETSRSRSTSAGSVGKQALLAGLGAALSHFLFDVAPKASGLSGGALSIVVEDLQEKHRRGQPTSFSTIRPIQAKQGDLDPVSVYLTFKF